MAMPKVALKKVVIDTRGMLIGFMVEAPANFFGNIGNDVIEYPKTLADLKAMKFCNKQIDMSTGKITELGNFKINNLPSMVYADNQLIDVDNCITLTRRYTSGSKVIGYGVRFEGFPGKPEIAQRSEMIAQMSKWLRPTNFMIRHNYSTGKMYLNGKDCSLSDLPEVPIGEKKTRKGTNKPVTARNQGQPIQKSVNPNVENTFDILDIYSIVEQLNGQIVHFPNSAYTPHSDSSTKTEEGFKNSKLGELASPRLEFNSTSLNVNAKFRKLGYVMVDLNGRGQAPINTFVYRTKSIFVGGEAYIKKFGIVVSKEKETELMNTIGQSLALTPYDLGSVQSAVERFGNVSNPVCFSVDASSLSLISKAKAENSLLTEDQIVTLCKKRYEAKLIRKYCTAVQNEAKKELGTKIVSEQLQKREIYSEFRLYSDEILEKLKEIGFDVYSGAYSSIGVSDSQDASSKTKSSRTTDEVFIDYMLKDYDDTKTKAADIRKAIRTKDTKIINENMINLLSNGETLSSPFDRYSWAEKLIDKANKQINEVNKAFWMHNATMFKSGDKKLVHTHDSKNWVPAQTRAKKYEVYSSTKIDGLILKLSGLRVKGM